jgi:ribose 1,5-bisphosphokinase
MLSRPKVALDRPCESAQGRAFFAPSLLVSATGGLFICVVGPSGAGKDTLLRHVQSELAQDGRFVVPRRCVTRPPSAHEDHIVLTEAEYAKGMAEGRFALAWRAHGLGYAIDSDVLSALGAGRIVICNVSREAIAPARRAFSRIATILITAPDSALAERLATRGRETGDGIKKRLARNRDVADDFIADFTIDNSGPVAAAVQQLVGFLRGLARAHEPTEARTFE